MRSVLVHGELSGEELGQLLAAVRAQPQSSAAYAFGTTRVLLYTAKKFFFRTNDYLGLVILSTTDGVDQRIDLGWVGGGSGLMGLQMGAGDDIEDELFDALMRLIASKGLRYGDPGSPAGPGGTSSPDSPLP